MILRDGFGQSTDFVCTNGGGGCCSCSLSTPRVGEMMKRSDTQKRTPSTTTTAAGQSTPVSQEDFYQTKRQRGWHESVRKSLAKFCCSGWDVFRVITYLCWCYSRCCWCYCRVMARGRYGPVVFAINPAVSGAFIQKVRAHTVKH